MGYITSGGKDVWEIRNSSNTALVAFGTVLMLRLLPLAFYIAPKLLGPLCSSIYYIADVVLITFLNGLRFVLSLFDILTGLQAQLLFNTAYARQVRLRPMYSGSIPVLYSTQKAKRCNDP